MDKAQIQAIETQEKIRALVVAAGLMSEIEAEQCIVVQVARLDEATLRDIKLPSHCDECGCEHSPEDWTPLEIGIARTVPPDVRDKIMLLMNQTGGPTN